MYEINYQNINPIYFGEDNLPNEILDINSLVVKLENDQALLEDQKLTFVVI